MDVFSVHNTPIQTSSVRKRIAKTSEDRPDENTLKKRKPRPNDSVIREKFKQFKADKIAKMQEAIAAKEKPAFAMPEIDEAKKPKQQEKLDKKPEKELDKEPVGQIGLNDPNNTDTAEKLRDLISSGGFNFSDKEKSVLSKILNK